LFFLFVFFVVNKKMLASDETNITEIELLPNGRICVFGTSLEVLDVLDELQSGLDENVRRRIEASTSNLLSNRDTEAESSTDA
jgi:hypothetical protein